MPTYIQNEEVNLIVPEIRITAPPTEKPASADSQWSRWLVVVVYAIAMAWMESAVVLYLRKMMNRIDPYQTPPMIPIGGVAFAEVVREAATMVMLLAVGCLAGRTWRNRLGYAFIAFGIWDIFYYVFLMPLSGWPNGLLDWDLLFLIPLPWWGPVLAPVLIALLMILWGTLASQYEGATYRLREWPLWLPTLSGVVLALYVFMADALRVVPEGLTAVSQMLPVSFNWPLFSLALLLMSAPVWKELRHRAWQWI